MCYVQEYRTVLLIMYLESGVPFHRLFLTVTNFETTDSAVSICTHLREERTLRYLLSLELHTIAFPGFCSIVQISCSPVSFPDNKTCNILLSGRIIVDIASSPISFGQNSKEMKYKDFNLQMHGDFSYERNSSRSVRTFELLNTFEQKTYLHITTSHLIQRNCKKT